MPSSNEATSKDENNKFLSNSAPNSSNNPPSTSNPKPSNTSTSATISPPSSTANANRWLSNYQAPLSVRSSTAEPVNQEHKPSLANATSKAEFDAWLDGVRERRKSINDKEVKSDENKTEEVKKN